jgi:hypothetical protein
MKTGTVIVVAHGQEEVSKTMSDSLTTGGVTDISITAGWFKPLRSPYSGIKSIEYSGANVTRQCANIAQAALSLWSVPIVKNRGWHPYEAFFNAFRDDHQAYEAELEQIEKAGGTVYDALKISKYALEASAQLISTIINSLTRNDNEPVLAYSHNHFASLGFPNLPYNIEPASVIVYTVDISANLIVGAEHRPYINF